MSYNEWRKYMKISYRYVDACRGTIGQTDNFEISLTPKHQLHLVTEKKRKIQFSYM